MLKEKIIEKLILVFPDFQYPFQVKCDDSGMTIGVVLTQDDKLVACFIEKLNETQNNYSTYNNEFYVVIQSLEKWGHYLMPKVSILYTDYHALQFITRQDKMNQRHAKDFGNVYEKLLLF